MRDPTAAELRKIRHLLTGVLACLIVLVLLALPGLFYFIAIAVLVFVLLVLAMNLTHWTRTTLGNAWIDLTSIFRR